MAKKKTAKKQAPPPDHLTMRLFAPGMTEMHRAGLGGLAATLKLIERRVTDGTIDVDQLPGEPWDKDESPPWSVTSDSITLHFGKPEGATEFFERLFAFAFDLEDDLLSLPAQYDGDVPTIVRAMIQQGITLTFLQHGQTRKLAEKSTELNYNPEGKPGTEIIYEYKACKSYKHQSGWKDLVDKKKGTLNSKTIEVAGPISPGSVVRHNAFASQTKIEETADLVLPLYFSLIGCLTRSINRGCGVLIVPEVVDLLHFAKRRCRMTPRNSRECQIAGGSDAVLQTMVRLRTVKDASKHQLPGYHAITFQPTPWASQQKSRVHSVYIPAVGSASLDQFETALACLPPKVISVVKKEAKGRGKSKEIIERGEHFWVNSVVRAMVAENLARGNPWYSGFVDLMTKIDPVGKQPIRNKVLFERKGLNEMINKIQWQDRGEGTVVRAVHEAMRRRYGKISSENVGKSAAMKNRMSSEYDRWRLAFAGAKTPEQFRKSICDLLSRAGITPVLQSEWKVLLPMLDVANWQQTRDLALLALASYSGKGSDDVAKALEEQAEEEEVA
ncbi:MAG: type I-MYXAN CRISPR-associated Cas8a1/Cmx1 [bacterium]|nr:type I-MYXAN CRISPR-associated Cas8a1/Cmx1 [bacterium]